MNILICGNFGYRTDQRVGQTVRTRVIKETLAETLGRNNVSQLDTSYFFAKPVQFLFSAKRLFGKHSHIIILPAQRALPILLPLFMRWNRKAHKQIRYVAIGGWLPPLLARKSRLRKLCGKLDGIYVQTQGMVRSLTEIGLRNVRHFPNFRTFDRKMVRNHAVTTQPFKLVFYSRVCKEKGIEDAIAAVHRINGDGKAPTVVLDVYGPILEEYKDTFFNLIANSANIVYRGMLTEKNVYQVLQTYDLLLLPTYYATEGFPGAILDAYVAGVPVLASDWMYSREIIDEGKTGVIISAGSVEGMTTEIRKLIASPGLIMDMRRHCISKANEFHSDYVIHRLLSDMDLKPMNTIIKRQQGIFE